MHAVHLLVPSLADLEVQVREQAAGGEPCIGDVLTAPDLLAGLDERHRQVDIGAVEARARLFAVLDLHHDVLEILVAARAHHQEDRVAARQVIAEVSTLFSGPATP